MLRSIIAASAAAILLLTVPAGAADQSWKIDPAHSEAEFGIKHLGLSTVKGRIPIQTGTIVLATGKDIPESVETTLAVSGIDTQNDNRDKDLKTADWFDAGKYPTITFKSTKISGSDPANFVIDGDITIHGITKPVELQAHLEGKGVGMRGEKRVAFSATTVVDRRDFGVGDAKSTNALGALIVGTDAAISLQVEAVAAP